MKILQKFAIALLLTISLIAPVFSPVAEKTAIAKETTTVKINRTKLMLLVGKSYTLKITGTRKKIIWSSNRKMVAAVSRRGYVKARTTGTAVITAAIGNKNYNCKVIVRKNTSTRSLAKVPFQARELILKKISMVIPRNWASDTEYSKSEYIAILTPPHTVNGCRIQISFTPVQGKVPSYSFLKAKVTAGVTKESLTQMYRNNLDDSFSIMNLEHSDVKLHSGSAVKTSYGIDYKNNNIENTIYYFYIDNYYIELMLIDADDLNVETAVEYILNSIIIKK